MFEDMVSVSIRIESLCGHAISEKIGLPVPSGHISMCPDRKDKPMFSFNSSRKLPGEPAVDWTLTSRRSL